MKHIPILFSPEIEGKRVLNLTVKKKWFDMIGSGEKKEEYREIKPYWVRRIIDTSEYPAEDPGEYTIIADNICYDIDNGHNWEAVIRSYFCKLSHFDAVLFRNGYHSNSPKLLVECKGVDIGPARPEWSDNWPGNVIRIHLGKIIETKQLSVTGKPQNI